jgi:hypothetical protein
MTVLTFTSKAEQSQQKRNEALLDAIIALDETLNSLLGSIAILAKGRLAETNRDCDMDNHEISLIMAIGHDLTDVKEAKVQNLIKLYRERVSNKWH